MSADNNDLDILQMWSIRNWLLSKLLMCPFIFKAID